MRRGFLVKPDPALIEPCARPECEHIEGDHLISGCIGTRSCGCPGFALPAPTCPHCLAEFDQPHQLDIHVLVRSSQCRAVERRRAAEAERQRRRDAKAAS